MFGEGAEPVQGGAATAGRKRAAVELVAHEEPGLRQMARRYSLCEDDAEDAYQRALEILLVKAPSDRPEELGPWMRTVVKHEALAIRRQRERMLGTGREEEGWDPIASLAASGAGPGEAAERREQVARSREALQALKPAELRALALLAAGCSYAEIGRITGFSRTKINRCLAEGRERFRRLMTHSESGGRCADLAPLLSAYCDGESRPGDDAAVREHLRACVGCRATLRSYRATPAAVAALAPALPVSRSLLERAQEALVGLQARLAGRTAGDVGISQVAATGGARGAGMAALAKTLAICAGTVGGATACIATGVVPSPLSAGTPPSAQARIERVSPQVLAEAAAAEQEPVPAQTPIDQRTADAKEPTEAVADEAAEPAVTDAAEYSPPAPVSPAPEPAAATPEASSAPAPAPASGSGGGAAGEFGP
jgi:RNA polymerase sigma factor (sigma-70 family)